MVDLVRRGLKEVKLGVSDAHGRPKAAITCIVGTTWPRCRIHFMRNALAHVPEDQTTMVAAAIRQVFLKPQSCRRRSDLEQRRRSAARPLA